MHDGLPATLLCDSAAAALMASGKVDAGEWRLCHLCIERIALGLEAKRKGEVLSSLLLDGVGGSMALRVKLLDMALQREFCSLLPQHEGSAAPCFNAKAQ